MNESKKRQRKTLADDIRLEVMAPVTVVPAQFVERKQTHSEVWRRFVFISFRVKERLAPL